MTYTPRTVWIGGPPVRRQNKKRGASLVVASALQPAKQKQAMVFFKEQCRPMRDATIFQRRKAGEAYKDIAIWAGVTKQRCRQIYEQMAGAVT